MMPGDDLSSIPVSAQFIGGRRLYVRHDSDYETGGIALNDPSRGLNYQTWHAYLNGDDVMLEAEHVAPAVLYSAPGITEISIAFDQNMRPALAFVQDGIAYLRWYDTQLGAQVVTAFPGAENPRITMDDKRATQSLSNDIIFAYLKAGTLCTRKQRDRYGIEYTHTSGLDHALIKIGMNRAGRLQFMLQEKR